MDVTVYWTPKLKGYTAENTAVGRYYKLSGGVFDDVEGMTEMRVDVPSGVDVRRVRGQWDSDNLIASTSEIVEVGYAVTGVILQGQVLSSTPSSGPAAAAGALVVVRDESGEERVVAAKRSVEGKNAIFQPVPLERAARSAVMRRKN